MSGNKNQLDLSKNVIHKHTMLSFIKIYFCPNFEYLCILSHVFFTHDKPNALKKVLQWGRTGPFETCGFADVKPGVFTESHTEASETHKPHSCVQSCYLFVLHVIRWYHWLPIKSSIITKG